MNDEELSAFLDRELNEAQRAEAARALSQNPGASARMFIFRRGDEVLRQAISVPLSPNDHALAQRIMNAPPVINRYARWARPVIAIAAGAVLGLMLGRETTSPLSLPRIEAQVQTALNELPSGVERQTGIGAVTVAMTLRQADGRLCRQFRTEMDRVTTESVACRDDDRWSVVAIAAAAERAPEFHTAGELNSGLAVVLNAVGDATMIEEREEQRLIADGWSESADEQNLHRPE